MRPIEAKRRAIERDASVEASGTRLHVRGVAAQVVLSFDGKKNIAF